MAKKVTGMIKLQIPAGQANPAPPVGPALGQQGVNIMAFCKEFNAATKGDAGMGLQHKLLICRNLCTSLGSATASRSTLLNEVVGPRRCHVAPL